jgi:hypothetical protein
MKSTRSDDTAFGSGGCDSGASVSGLLARIRTAWLNHHHLATSIG